MEKIISLKTILSFTPARAQNIVVTASTNLAANPAQLTEMDFSELIWRIPDFKAAPQGPEAPRAAAKLEAQGRAVPRGFPWKPFHPELRSRTGPGTGAQAAGPLGGGEPPWSVPEWKER